MEVGEGGTEAVTMESLSTASEEKVEEGDGTGEEEEEMEEVVEIQIRQLQLSKGTNQCNTLKLRNK